MKSTKIFICLSLLLFPVYLLASPLGCPSYYPKTQQKLIAVSVFNTDKAGVLYELAPEEKPRKENNPIVNQHWDNMSDTAGLKAFFTCSYLDTNKKITQEISDSIKTCRFIFYYPDKKNIKFINTFFCD